MQTLTKTTAVILLVWSLALTVMFFRVNSIVNTTRVQSNTDNERLNQVVGCLNQIVPCFNALSAQQTPAQK